jgi:hypothetical protein
LVVASSINDAAAMIAVNGFFIGSSYAKIKVKFFLKPVRQNQNIVSP